MSVLEVGDNFPGNVSFGYIPLTPESEGITSCGIPTKYDASESRTLSLYLILQTCCVRGMIY